MPRAPVGALASRARRPSFCGTTARPTTCAPLLRALKFITKYAPLGVVHLKELIRAGFYNNSAIFRVVPGFVVQFGIAGDPAMNARFAKAIKDDPPVGRSNVAGTISYAMGGPDSRTTQLFVNLADNSEALDKQGFVPLGLVYQGASIGDLAKALNPTPGDPSGIDQNKYETLGNDWLRANYNNVSWINDISFM